MNEAQELADQFDIFIAATPEQRARLLSTAGGPTHPRYSKVPQYCVMLGSALAILVGVGGLIVFMTAFALSLM